MGDVIDFVPPRRKRTSAAEPSASRDGDGAELIYDLKPGSVGVRLMTEADGTVHFMVTAPGDQIADAVASARSALVASFGADPSDLRAYDLVCSTVGEVTCNAFVTTFVQQHFFNLAMQRTGIMPFLEPELLTDDVPVAGQDYTFRVDALVRPYIELESYDPVKIELPQKAEVTSKDVTAYLDNMADQLATWENDPARDMVADGDHVTLNLDATCDSRPFEPLCGRHVPYVVGTGALGADFDRNVLVGMAPRERRETSVSLPATDAQGAATFQLVAVKVQVDEIQRKVPAKIDDLWVQQNMPEAQTLLGLRTRVRSVLEREADLSWRDEIMARCTDVLAERLVDEPGEVYVEKMRDELVSQFIAELQRQGVDYQAYLSQPGFDRDAWERSMTEEAEASLRRGIALDSLADHLDLQVTEEDVARVVAGMAPGQEEAALRSMLDSGQMPKLCEAALRLKASEWLADQATGASSKPRRPGPMQVIDGSGPRTPRDPKSKGDGPKLQLV
jgi:trigger factor